MERIETRPQSLSAVYFSTKGRRPFLAAPQRRRELHAFLGGICAHLNCPSLLIGGVEDHVHLLVRFGRSISQADFIKELKRVSSRWAAERTPEFGWQAGYGVFSVSPPSLDAVRQYIATQEEHHREITFQDEFLALLREHNETWDERYLWD